MVDDNDPIAALRAQAKTSGWLMRVEDALEFDHPPLNQLRDIWREKAALRGSLPERSDFDARTLKPFLRHLTIVERVPDAEGRSHFRFRLQGTLLAQYFGDQTGKFLEASIPPGIIEAWNIGYDALLAGRRPVRVLNVYEIPNAEFLSGESFAVPLGNGADPPNSVLTATFFRPRDTSLMKAG